MNRQLDNCVVFAWYHSRASYMGRLVLLQEWVSLKLLPLGEAHIVLCSAEKQGVPQPFRSTTTTSSPVSGGHAQSCLKFPSLPSRLRAHTHAQAEAASSWQISCPSMVPGVMGDLPQIHSWEIAMREKAHTQCHKKACRWFILLKFYNVPRCNTVRKHTKVRIRDQQSIKSAKEAPKPWRHVRSCESCWNVEVRSFLKEMLSKKINLEPLAGNAT